MRLVPWALLFMGWLPPAASAQFQLSVLAGGAEQPVASVYDFGRVASGDGASAHFRLRNTSNAAARLTLLQVAGTGFSLFGGPSLPVTLMPQAAADFMVAFTASLPGRYSAAIRADGISSELAAEVVPGLTFQVETAVGKISLGSSVDFGSASVGQGTTLRFDISNQTGLALPIPAIALSSSDFTFSGAVPAGVLLPGQGSSFVLQFLPMGTGLRTALLTIGARTYGLTGTGIVPDLPQPRISIELPQAQSAQQGSLRLTFDRPAATSGSGTLAISFDSAVEGATDPTIAFASGGNTAIFTFATSDTEAHFGVAPTISFQTGTTAGTLVFTAQVGDASNEQTITIVPAPVGVTALQATRSNGVAIQLYGFDNTRTAAALTFWFFDTEGNTLAGPIPADGRPAFDAYFQGSETGGSFVLQAVFPVTGDTARIASFTASLANQAGTTTTARTPF